MVKKSVFVLSLVVAGMVYESSAQADPTKQSTLFDYYSSKTPHRGPIAPKKNPPAKAQPQVYNNYGPSVEAPTGPLTKQQKKNARFVRACVNKYY